VQRFIEQQQVSLKWITQGLSNSGRKRSKLSDEGMTNGPPIFAYLVFGPGRVFLERLLRPIKTAV
jgi:hypothetical protein